MWPKIGWLVVCLGLVSCNQGPEDPPGDPARASEESELVLQAVDAGTGSALADERMTVRYLVRSPITLDAAGSESVPSARPYRISHSVAEDSLVVEVRFEAPSYYRIDTVFAVPRGESAGPLTVRMARRLDRMASSDQTSGRDESGSGEGGASSPGGSGDVGGSGAGVDRAPLIEGDRAFESRDWVGATLAYDQMTPPADPSGSYGRAYRQGLVRQGISHIRLGEWGSALDALERATAFDGASALAYFHLGRSQCAVGRLDEGRRSLDQVEARRSTLPPEDRDARLLLADYERAICTELEFDRADEPTELLRVGGQAMRELEAFVDAAETSTSRRPDVAEAIGDARERVEEIRSELLRLGRN